MEISPVDPRDTRWEQTEPTFRVYFWERSDAAGVSIDDLAWRSEEWRLTGVTDVRPALVWATGPAGRGREFELFVEADQGGSTGLVRVAGRHPLNRAGGYRPVGD